MFTTACSGNATNNVRTESVDFKNITTFMIERDFKSTNACSFIINLCQAPFTLSPLFSQEQAVLNIRDQNLQSNARFFAFFCVRQA